MNSRIFYFEVCRLINSINDHYDEYAKNHGIQSSNSFWILYYLSYGDKCTQLDICNHCQLPKTTVNTIIKDLEAKEFVCLTYGYDKRERLISLTNKGKKYADELLKDLFSKEDKVFLENKELLMQMIELMKRFDNSLEILTK